MQGPGAFESSTAELWFDDLCVQNDDFLYTIQLYEAADKFGLDGPMHLTSVEFVRRMPNLRPLTGRSLEDESAKLIMGIRFAWNRTASRHYELRKGIVGRLTEKRGELISKMLDHEKFCELISEVPEFAVAIVRRALPQDHLSRPHLHRYQITGTNPRRRSMTSSIQTARKPSIPQKSPIQGPRPIQDEDRDTPRKRQRRFATALAPSVRPEALDNQKRTSTNGWPGMAKMTRSATSRSHAMVSPFPCTV